jgi:hypothetical protein
MVTATSVATTSVVVTIVVATSITSIDYPIFTLQNKHRSKFSYQNFNLHSPCDEITALVTMGTTTSSYNFSTNVFLVLKLFHPKKRLSHSHAILKHTQIVYVENEAKKTILHYFNANLSH